MTRYPMIKQMFKRLAWDSDRYDWRIHDGLIDKIGDKIAASNARQTAAMMEMRDETGN